MCTYYVGLRHTYVCEKACVPKMETAEYFIWNATLGAMCIYATVCVYVCMCVHVCWGMGDGWALYSYTFR